MTAPLLSSARRLVLATWLGFASFGAFWGVWGASVPQVQHQAGIDDGELGLALLFIGAGAPPAMLLMGRALDRWGFGVAGVATAALGVVGVVVVATAQDLTGLCVGLAAVGATSGAADVGCNALAGRAQETAARPVITRAHGVFSLLVVVGSLATGWAAAVSLPLVVPYLAVAALTLLAGASMARALRGSASPASVVAADASVGTDAAEALAPRFGPAVALPFLLVGLLGALALATENAHQSWSAVFAETELATAPGLSAVAPAVFAGTVAATRFAAGGLGAVHARAVLLAGGAGAAAGTLLVAVAPTLLVAGLGLALAAAGTAVLFPTLMAVVSRNVDDARRGRATSVVTIVSYLGFIVGPVYVGLWSDAVGLRGAMLAVAALAIALVMATPALLRVSGLSRGLAEVP